MMTGMRNTTVLLLATVLFSACERRTPAPPAPAAAPLPASTVTGRVSYLQRIALADEAIITVAVTDVTTGQRLAEQVIPSQGKQPPISFQVDYDSAKVRPGDDYAVSARITLRNQTVFASDTPYLVITKGRPTQVDILVKSPNN